ncbi:MAG: dephospho-CoA kinase [Halioglobus sp.]|nr:dephospho-CoA kinase [Halioglobus sp.]
MLVVGVTGGIGSGKSAVTERFAAHGITVIDADVIARDVVAPDRPALADIARHFGSGILLADGSLDRAALRQRVFADGSERLWLEQLTHPLIGKDIIEQINRSTSPYTILASPLLLETGQQALIDVAVVVDVPEAVQLQRTMQRDNNTADQVRRIMAAQMTRNDRLAKADYIIDNSGALDTLDTRVSSLHQTFLQRALQ